MNLTLTVNPTGEFDPTENPVGPAFSKHRTDGGVACRGFDLIVAIFALIFTAPLLVVLAIAVKLADGGPIFFRHARVGLGGRQFYCFKFRTMMVDADERLAALLASDPDARVEWERDHKLRRDPRTTPIGSFLRKSSLDELPQLLNVLWGEMSIVGPRPIVDAEIRRYGSRYASYCRVRPGITGLWQISGRNDTTYRRRVALDTVYTKNKSFWWDVKIVALTLPAVLLAKGSY